MPVCDGMIEHYSCGLVYIKGNSVVKWFMPLTQCACFGFICIKPTGYVIYNKLLDIHFMWQDFMNVEKRS